jgi:hypothetical protein
VSRDEDQLENHEYLVLYGGVRATIDVIERRSARPGSCGQGTPEVAFNADVMDAHGGPAVTIFPQHTATGGSGAY